MLVSLVFDLESWLVDVAAGVRHALNCIARAQGTGWPIPLSDAELRARPIETLLGGVAGSDDPALIDDLLGDYRQIYFNEARFRAPLRPGALALVRRLVARGVELHYLSTHGPEVATQLVRQHGLARAFTTVYATPQPIPPCARAGLFESFMARRDLPVTRHRLLSDNLGELAAAWRQEVPALALAYSLTAPPAPAIATAAFDLAGAPGDVLHWLDSEDAVQAWLGNRPTSRLPR